MEEGLYDDQLNYGPEYSDGLELYYGALFTTEEIELLNDTLYQHENNNITEFISSILPICRYKYNCVHEVNTSSDIRKNRKGIIKSLNITLSLLRYMTAPKERLDKFYINIADNIIPNCKILTGFEIIRPEWYYKFISVHENAGLLIDNIDNFLTEFMGFDKSLNKIYSKGRKQADFDDFYRQIAEVYLLHIGKPTTQKDGEFMNVMRIINKAVGIPSEDPSRGVRQALKKIMTKISP
ncbi:MAG: hypothetical protein JJE09_06675 [Bacteroidia bacterium]|nr:hypothetical protein [Bacteroidia bacterium]